MVLDKGNQEGNRRLPGVRRGGSVGLLEVCNTFETETAGMRCGSQAVNCVTAYEDSVLCGTLNLDDGRERSSGERRSEGEDGEPIKEAARLTVDLTLLWKIE